MRRDMMVDMELTKSGAKNIKAVRALLNEEAITLLDGGLCGIEQEIERIGQDCPYLFCNRAAWFNPPAPKAGASAVSIDESERWRTEAGLPAKNSAVK